MGWGAHAWIWMKYIYSSCVLLFISGVFQALSVKNKDFINLNIGEVWAQLHKHQQNDVASLVFGLHMRTGNLCPWEHRTVCHRFHQGCDFTAHRLITSPWCYFLPCPIAHRQLPIPPSGFSAFTFLGCQLTVGERRGSKLGRDSFNSLRSWNQHVS